MAMTVEDFLGIVKGGWRVSIVTEGTADPESGGQRIESARIADASRPASFIEVTPVDGIVDVDQLAKALVFLNGGVARVGERDDNAEQLVLAFLASDQRRPLPLPRGMQYAAAPDGTTITDDRGTELGRIDRDASIRDAGDAVVDAVAARAAAGLISRPSKVLDASSDEMSAVADVGDAEIEEMVAALQAMPAEGRPAAADPSADEVNRMKANRIAGRQRQLLSEVPERLRTRGVILKGTLDADALAELCKANEHTFSTTTGRGGITGYQIVDPSGALVASGELKATFLAPRNRYLPREEVQSLLGQLDDATLQNYIKGISPDTLDAVHESDAEVQEFADQHSESGDDPERGEHGEGPDPSSTGKP